MWHDNETDVDFLGFDQLVETIMVLIQSNDLLPLTIGAFGDWGSGKSSLMAMARKRLEANERYVCVAFSPWQYENYDDVRAALMASVMTALRDRRGLLEKVGEASATQVKSLWGKLAKRIDWFRAVGAGAKGIGSAALLVHGHPGGAGLAASSLHDISQIMRPESLETAGKEIAKDAKDLIKKPDQKIEIDVKGHHAETAEQSIGEFRTDFAALLQHLDIDALVVFIDDLDRCLPPNIIDTLEAVRLFLAVPKTAFILGADERIVRHAIATRYPEMAGQSVSIGRDYLEKMIQIPVRIPPLTAAETETYLNLLGCSLYLVEPAHRSSLVTAATDNRRKGTVDVAMNYGIAHSVIGELPQPLQEHMQLVARIAPTLCGGLQGNPRQTKRFFNTLLLRQRLASTRGVDLDAAILAKLMLLEYFQEAYFRQLFQWVSQGQGRTEPIIQLEQAARGTSVGDELSADMRRWLDDPAISDWLQLEPALAGVGLDPYFYFSRDRVFSVTAPGRRLNQQMQELVGKLQSESDAERKNAVAEALKLTPEEIRPAYDVLLKRFEQDPRALSGKIGSVIVEIATKRPELVTPLAQSLRATPPDSIQPSFPVSIRNQFGAKTPLPRDLEDVLQGWSQQGATPLGKAAKRALETREGR